VVRVTWISVWNVHVGKSEAIEERAVIVADIIENHTLALVESDADMPLLPLNDARSSLLRDREAGTLRLNDIERLEISPQSLVFGHVLIGWFGRPRLDRADGVISTGWQDVHSEDLPGRGADDW